MTFLGMRNKVLSRWMTLHADRKRKEARREMPDSYISCRDKKQNKKTNMSMKVPYRFSDWENAVTVSHLEEQEDRWRGAETSVIQSDDGGATGAKQVSHLWKKKITSPYSKMLQFCLQNICFSSEFRTEIYGNVYKLLCFNVKNKLSVWLPWIATVSLVFFNLKMLKLSTVSSLSQTDMGLFLCTCMLVMRNMTPPAAIMGRAG